MKKHDHKGLRESFKTDYNYLYNPNKALFIVFMLSAYSVI